MRILRKYKVFNKLKIKTDYNIVMKKMNKYIRKKYTRKNMKKYTRKNMKKYIKKNKKRYTRKNKKKFYLLKGGYADGVIPQVDFRPPGDPNFDDPFYQYQEGNDTCPYYPTKSEVKKCYKKHNGTAKDHAEADKCVQDLIDERYTEIPGKCNPYTCCDKFCDKTICPPWSRLITRGLAVPAMAAIAAGVWTYKTARKLSEDAALGQEKVLAKGAIEIVKDEKEDIKEASDVIEEVAPPIKIENEGAADKKEGEGEDKKEGEGEDKKEGEGEDKKEEKPASGGSLKRRKKRKS